MREIFTRAGTSLLSDIFDTLGLQPPILAVDFWPVPGPEPSFAGPAYTIRGRWNPWEGSGDREKLAAIDGIPEGVDSR